MSGVVVSRPAAVFSDHRGDIYDIVEGVVGHVGVVTFGEGAVRGNHYHRRSTQFTYVLRGRIELLTKAIDGSAPAETCVLGPGELAAVPARVVHTYRALEPAAIIDVTTLSRGESGYEDDTVRVEPR